MQTLIPQPATARAQPIGRTGRLLGFGLTPLALILFAASIALAAPAFWHPHLIWIMFAADALILALALLDAALLPPPAAFTLTRTFLDSPQLSRPTRIELTALLNANTLADLRLTDDLHPALIASPETQRLQAFPRDPATTILTVYPRERGDIALGRVYLRYRGTLKLAERWAAVQPVQGPNASILSNPLPPQPMSRSQLVLRIISALIACVAVGVGSIRVHYVSVEVGVCLTLFAVAAWLWRRSMSQGKTETTTPANAQPHRMPPQPQQVRIYPALEESRDRTNFYLLRARQIEMQKRRLRLRGTGRDFESLRDYQLGDELRNVSWTATARRNKLVARQFTVERSQQVWIVLDAGRLSRTAFELKRDASLDTYFQETEVERTAAHRLTVTQLDQATQAAAMLAQVINGSGDKFALMAYGRQLQQVLAPGSGPAHLRILIDQLSRTRSERAEADHLTAMARLKTMQRRRGLIIWITELTDTVGRPEIVSAAAELVRRHLVVLVLLKHPELDELAARTPTTRAEMFHAAAAQEMLERRRATIAQLERQGVLIVETTAAEVGINAISKYLEIKARGML